MKRSTSACVACMLVLQGLALAQPNLRPALPIPARPGGNIIFTRTLLQPVAGFPQGIPLSKLFVMGADGANPRPFFTPGEFYTAAQARWSADYDQLVFSSDWLEGCSACVSDIFCAQADGSDWWRVTGSEPPFVAAYGAIVGRIDAKIPGRVMAVQHTEVNIAASGSNLIYHPNPDMSFEIPLAAASEATWIKVWLTKNEGNFFTREVRPNQVNDVGTLKLAGTNLYARLGSISADGRWVVGMGGMVGTTREAQGPNLGPEGNVPSHQLQVGGADDVAIFDVARGGMLSGMYQAMKVAGNGAKDPAVSPDGRVMAVCVGQTGMESLCLMTLADLLADRPNPAPIVQGERIFPSELTMFMAGHRGAANPCWRPDGGAIAFCHAILMTELVTGEIAVVAPNGSGYRQITNFGPNHLACQPCFSPDGSRIAFTLITGKFGPMKPEQFLTAQFTADIYVMNADGSGVQRLTNDGISAEPAWGP